MHIIMTFFESLKKLKKRISKGFAENSEMKFAEFMSELPAAIKMWKRMSLEGIPRFFSASSRRRENYKVQSSRSGKINHSECGPKMLLMLTYFGWERHSTLEPMRKLTYQMMC